MTATYGSEEGRLSVGIDVSMSPSSVSQVTSSVVLTWTVYARATYAFNDAQTMTLSNALSATKGYTMNSDNYTTTTYKVGSWTQTVSTSYSGTVSKTLVAAASGLFNGGTPSHSRGFTIPKRPPQDPSAPTSASSTLVSGSQANIAWVRPSNASTTGYQWDNAIVQVSVNGGSYSTLATLSGTSTAYSHTGLALNTTYAYRVYGKNSEGSSATTSAGSVQTQLPAPTTITPAGGTTVTKPNPTLGATLVAIAGGVTQKAQWQFATDAGFTANVQVVTENNTDLRASGATTEAPTVDFLALPNGTWYIRARAIDVNDNAGPYSVATTFTVNTPVPSTPTAVTPASGASITTMTPTLGMTFAVDAAGRLMKGEWQLATNNTFTANVRTVTELDADLIASGATTQVVPVDLRITPSLGTTWYIRGRAIGNDGSTSAYTTVTSFTLSVTAPPAPTNITPATGSPTSLTNTPVLGATIVAATEGRTCKAEWQLATDAGFTANLRTVTESNSDLRASGATTEITPNVSKIYQGTWYIRARQIDEYGSAGAWSASQTFLVSHPPKAVPAAPIGGFTLPYGATNNFSWTFTDTSSTDTQSAYQIIIERNATGVVVFDSGKISSITSAGAHTVPALEKDVPLRWKVRVWDNDNVVGVYSDYALFAVTDPPLVTITLPTVGQTLTTGQPTFTWTNDAGTVQVSRRVVVVRTSDGVTVHDSGTTNTTSLSYTTPTVILENQVAYTVTITVNDNVGMTGTKSQSFTTAYAAPDAVQFTVDSDGYDEKGYVYVDWTATTPDAFFIDWRVYRRPVLADDWELIYVTNDPNMKYFNDWSATSGDTLEYAVTQTAGRFGIIIESAKAQTETREVEGTHYWLINPYKESDNLRLSNITSDSYTDDYDEAELIVLDRGRKVNHGTRFGYSGSLVAQLRDDTLGTAREKRIKLQMLKAARVAYQLRNPFGDILQVSLGNLAVSRLAGVGTAEFVDVTIPYKEVM